MRCPECDSYIRSHTSICPECGSILVAEYIGALDNLEMGNWDPLIHLEKAQLSKISRASSADCTPSSINIEAQTGIFPKNEEKNYTTSLYECTCTDFSRVKSEIAPCKHMYRLAMELHILNLPFETGLNKNLKPKPDHPPKEDPHKNDLIITIRVPLKTMDCCSHFRECSDAQRCVIADREYSNTCRYRDKLENGIVFYGKNSNGFSLEKYNTFISIINSLSSTAQDFFRKLVKSMHPYNYSTHTFRYSDFPEFRTEIVMEVLSCGIFVSHPHIESVLENHKYAELKDILKKYYPTVEERASIGIPALNISGNKLVKVIMEHCKEYCDDIEGKYFRISVVDELFSYIVEYYHEYINQ